jgi:hypothetical protein
LRGLVDGFARKCEMPEGIPEFGCSGDGLVVGVVGVTREASTGEEDQLATRQLAG